MLAYQCGRAVSTALVVAGLELVSIYLGGTW